MCTSPCWTQYVGNILGASCLYLYFLCFCISAYFWAQMEQTADISVVGWEKSLERASQSLSPGYGLSQPLWWLFCKLSIKWVLKKIMCCSLFNWYYVGLILYCLVLYWSYYIVWYYIETRPSSQTWPLLPPWGSTWRSCVRRTKCWVTTGSLLPSLWWPARSVPAKC